MNTTFEKTQRMLVDFKEAIHASPDQSRLYIDASIRRFKLSFDLMIKLLKKILENQGVQVEYPKQTLREAFSGKLIDDENVWITML